MLTEFVGPVDENGSLDVKDYSFKSGKHAWWKCSGCSHEWKAAFRTRADGAGCVKCGREKMRQTRIANAAKDNPIPQDSILRKEFVEPVIKTNPATIDGYSQNSDVLITWKCSTCLNNWNSIVEQRTQGLKCPHCFPRRLSKKKVSLTKNIHPVHIHQEFVCLENEDDFRSLYALHPGASIQAKWRCSSCSHEWTASVCNRSKGSKCPECSKTYSRQALMLNAVSRNPIPLVSILYLEFIEPVLDSDPKELKFYSTGSNKRAKWKCSRCDHNWEAVIGTRARGSGCPDCYQRQKKEAWSFRKPTSEPFPKDSILFQEYLGPVDQSLPKESINYFKSSQVLMNWCCSKCTFRWTASMVSRAVREHKCPQCSLSVKKTIEYPTTRLSLQLEKEFVVENEKALSEYERSSKHKAKWVCDLGHCFEATVASRWSGTMCTVCRLIQHSKRTSARAAKANPIPLPSILFIEFLRPVNNNDSTNLVDYSYQSNKRVWWRCLQCAHEWNSTVFDRTKGKFSSCPVCAKSGYNPSAPSIVYFLENPDKRIAKVGITNNFETRYSTLGKVGYSKIICQWKYSKGQSAYETEKEFFSWLRGQEVNFGTGKSDGYTESFLISDIETMEDNHFLEWENFIISKIESLKSFSGHRL